MMTYQEFNEKLENMISGYVESKYPELHVTMDTFPKDNEPAKDCILIAQNYDEKTVAAAVYPEDLYDMLRQGEDISEIYLHATQSVDHIAQNMQGVLDNKIAPLEDPEFVKKHVYLKVLNKEYNLDRLPNLVYQEKLDLIAACYVDLDAESIAMLHRTWCDVYNISPEDMFQIAYENTRSRGFTAVPMTHMIRELLKKEGYTSREIDEIIGGYEAPLTVITNIGRVYGSAALMYPELLEQVTEKLGTDKIYILPSSIHEVLACAGDMDVRELRDMVYEINRSTVSPQERLSDMVYQYDSKTKDISIAPIERRFRI